MLEECVLTSLTSEDDLTWERASAGNDSQGWYDAADGEYIYDNLNRFEVFRLVPAKSQRTRYQVTRTSSIQCYCAELSADRITASLRRRSDVFFAAIKWSLALSEA